MRVEKNQVFLFQKSTLAVKFDKIIHTSMNLKNFQTQISPVILQRGKAYFDEGSVSILEEEENGVWCAEVEGSEVYSVEVELIGNDEIEGYSCDCPHDADVCKHIVAVFYELKTRVKTVKLKPAKKGQALSFTELLKKVTVSELKEFVALFAGNDKNFKNQFELHFAHKDEHVDVEKQYTDLVKKIIRSSMSGGFVDYYSAGDLSSKADAILAKAEKAIDADNFKDASVIVRVVLKQLIVDVIPEADDSNGSIGATISDAISILGSIAESALCARTLKESIHDFLATELSNGVYFDYGDFGDDLFDVFRNLSVQLNRNETFLSFTSRFSKKSAEPGVSNYRAEYFTKQTILFLKETGKMLDAEKMIWQNLDIVEVRKGVVDEAINRKDYIEAKELIYQGIVLAEKLSHPGTVSQWQKVLLQIAVLEGDMTMQRHFNLLFAFDRGFAKEYYENWKKTFPKAEWEIEFDNLIRKIVDGVELEAKKHFNHPWWSKNQALLNRLAPLYVQEKQWDALYNLVEDYPSEEVLLEYLKYLAPHFQPQLTDLLFPVLLLAGDKANSRSNYAQIASNMQKIIKLMPASKSKILEAAQILRSRYPRRPAMIDELKKVG
ncbi:SWIM zinc finger family protein [Dyadobacter sp. LHD-138]|uniref:SWIM zinc finger family protein n=1 Tax=Dyadobacter sp. LHD-138 TaxID=3071413 RepID=UPI0027DF6093|nr:SWIM zinc finger family protein [Dyadobacter sp. LHD-138]MDQ6481044.1 SWIM zinc finger family protein [Dyadobacter sp. LHD-138]